MPRSLDGALITMPSSGPRGYKTKLPSVPLSTQDRPHVFSLIPGHRADCSRQERGPGGDGTAGRTRGTAKPLNVQMAGSRCAPSSSLPPWGLSIHRRTTGRTARSALHFCEVRRGLTESPTHHLVPDSPGAGNCTMYDHKGLSGPCPVGPPRLTCQFPWQAGCPRSTSRRP